MEGQALARCNELLAEGYGLLDTLGVTCQREEIPRLVLERAHGIHAAQLAAACQSFYLYRLLHSGGVDGRNVLLGDYFFSRFSEFLIPIDSTELIAEFSNWLITDTEEGVRGDGGFDLAGYRRFVADVSGRQSLC